MIPKGLLQPLPGIELLKRDTVILMKEVARELVERGGLDEGSFDHLFRIVAQHEAHLIYVAVIHHSGNDVVAVALEVQSVCPDVPKQGLAKLFDHICVALSNLFSYSASVSEWPWLSSKSCRFADMRSSNQQELL